MFFKISETSVANVTRTTSIHTHFGTMQRTTVALCTAAFQKPEFPGRRVCLCFSPALAAGRALAVALALTQPPLSARLGFETSPPPGPDLGPESWSKSGFSCSACLEEVCGAGSWMVGAGGPAGGGSAAAAAGVAPASSAGKKKVPRFVLFNHM